jgi:hypothetical protein
MNNIWEIKNPANSGLFSGDVRAVSGDADTTAYAGCYIYDSNNLSSTSGKL